MRTVCDLVHAAGGQVYIDGANLNALVGLAKPGEFGGDVSHLNLHKTFCIPHGGGGPGVGPVAVRAHLAPFLPGEPLRRPDGRGTVAAAAFGSAGILPITWAYLAPDGPRRADRGHRDRGADGQLPGPPAATRTSRCSTPTPNGLVAHECILDLRALTRQTGVTAEDVAKRLIDYGFHAPTLSFPVAGTLMVEPTESEDLAELDRFVDAMIAIRGEIDQVAAATGRSRDSPLRNAPHTAEMLLADKWDLPYPREQAAYPGASPRGPASTGRRCVASTAPTATATWSAPARRPRPSRTPPTSTSAIAETPEEACIMSTPHPAARRAPRARRASSPTSPAGRCR